MKYKGGRGGLFQVLVERVGGERVTPTLPWTGVVYKGKIKTLLNRNGMFITIHIFANTHNIYTEINK